MGMTEEDRRRLKGGFGIVEPMAAPILDACRFSGLSRSNLPVPRRWSASGRQVWLTDLDPDGHRPRVSRQLATGNFPRSEVRRLIEQQIDFVYRPFLTWFAQRGELATATFGPLKKDPTH